MVIHGVPVSCINQAAVRYHVPATIIISILELENGRLGTRHHNRNGSTDYGPMQINSVWLKRLKPYGITWKNLTYNGCENVNVGTWILSQNIALASSLAKGIGNYHSHSSKENQRYQHLFLTRYRHLMTALKPTTHYIPRPIPTAHLSPSQKKLMKQIETLR